jgi:hypothetical protein
MGLCKGHPCKEGDGGSRERHEPVEIPRCGVGGSAEAVVAACTVRGCVGQPLSKVGVGITNNNK